jgi:hypothetical protein
MRLDPSGPNTIVIDQPSVDRLPEPCSDHLGIIEGGKGGVARSGLKDLM